MNTIGKMTMFKWMLNSQKTPKAKGANREMKVVKKEVKKEKVKEKVIGISKTSGMTINGINRNSKNNKHNKKVRLSKERVVEEMKKHLWTTKTTTTHMMQSKTGRENQGIN